MRVLASFLLIAAFANAPATARTVFDDIQEASPKTVWEDIQDSSPLMPDTPISTRLPADGAAPCGGSECVVGE